jgi:hypothetical protein
MERIFFMKKVIIGLIVFLLAPMSFFIVSEMDTLATALTFLGKDEEGKQPRMPGVISHRTPEERAKRVEEIRARIRQNLIVTPVEARDALVEYLFVRFAEIFQPLADSVGQAAARINPRLGELVKRLPGTVSEASLLIYTLLKDIFKKEYFTHLKQLNDPVRCLFAKPAERALLSDAEGNSICKDETLKTALLEVLDKGRAVLEPFAKALIVGGKIGNQEVKGLIEVGAGTIDPKLGDEVAMLRPIFALILELPGQLREAAAQE